MGKHLTGFYLVFVYAMATLAIRSDCSDHTQPKVNAALFVFGDSVFDCGNNNYINTTPNFKSNFSPYGETFFGYATGRFSNGRIIPDFIAEFAKLPLIPPFLDTSNKNKWAYGVNFASGGAGALVETFSGLAIDLKTQVGYLEDVEKELRSKIGEKEASQLLSNSVYLFSVGANDLLTPSSEYSSYSRQDYTAIVIGNVTDVIKKLHKKGARKFGFVNMGPLGCLPRIRGDGGEKGECAEEITSLVKSYNAAFAETLEELEKQLQGFQYSSFDSFTVGMDMINNPSKYGFKEVKIACCGSGAFRGTNDCGRSSGENKYEVCEDVEEHLFFDFGHRNEKAYRIMAELMWHGVPNITKPSNLKWLFQLNSHQPANTCSIASEEAQYASCSYALV